jgi:hypothetical protein
MHRGAAGLWETAIADRREQLVDAKPMKTEKPTKLSKTPEANHTKVDLGGLAAGIHAAVALAHASGEPLPRSLAESFYTVLEAELQAVLPRVRKLE